MKKLGIVAHSAEGASLCFITACRHGSDLLGPYMHPEIVMSAIPMALSMPGWESGDMDAVAEHLASGVRVAAEGGAEFYICPDNTAHIVLETTADTLPIPGLHIADVVCDEIRNRGFKRVGLTGTEWTMTGPVYERALRQSGTELIVPERGDREVIHSAIFDDLCHGRVTDSIVSDFIRITEKLKDRGAECVILGCTEIPLVLNDENSRLPTIDSTRLLARRAIDLCVNDSELVIRDGWVQL
ncbi:MAG: amino acid racemase [Phycisphaera sp.]|nr:MAG: amino acid racemase [Phycisphaera sp.]